MKRRKYESMLRMEDPITEIKNSFVEQNMTHRSERGIDGKADPKVRKGKRRKRQKACAPFPPSPSESGNHCSTLWPGTYTDYHCPGHNLSTLFMEEEEEETSSSSSS